MVEGNSHDARRLLWIDDDGEKRFKYEAKKLKKRGYDIQWAQTGKQAVELLELEDFDVVILDQQLPWDNDAHSSVWGGILLLAWCRAEPRPGAAPAIKAWDGLFSRDSRKKNIDSKILVVSAFYDDRIAEAREKLGVKLADTLSKPVDFPMLLARINGS